MQFRPWTMFVPRPPLHGLADSPSSSSSSSATSVSVPGAAAAAGRVSVKVTSRVPAQAVLGVLPPDALLGADCVDHRSISRVIQVEWRDGAPVVRPGCPQRWVAHILPARDRHEQNVEATRDVGGAGGSVVLRTMRPLSKGEHLYVWYGEGLAREAGIPPLTPEHIRGERQYSCTRCPRTFEYPNSLKAHLRFHCPARALSGTVPSCSPAAMLGLPSAFPDRRRRTVLDVPRRDLTSPTSSAPAGPTDLRVGIASAFRPHRRTLDAHPRPAAHQGSLVSPTRQNAHQAALVSPTRGEADEARQNSHQATLVSPMRGESPREHVDDKRSEPSPRVLGRPNGAPSREDTEKLAMRGTCPAPSNMHPIQIFNHIHPPAYPVPFDHSAIKYYYPLLGRFPGNGQYCYSALPTPPYLPGGLVDPAMYGMHPYGLQRLVSLPQDRERLEAQAKQASPQPHDGHVHLPQGVPLNFPLPSDKAGEPLDLLPRSLYMNKSRKGHLCIYCGKLYSRKYGLKIHLRTHTGYKPLKCKVCLRPFGDPSNLNKHIRLHAEGDTPYRCEYCGKVLVRRRDLERHIKSRHPNEAQALEDGKFPVPGGDAGVSLQGDLGTLGDDEDEDDIDVDSESHEDPDEDDDDEELAEIEVVA